MGVTGSLFAIIWDCEFLTDVGAPQRFWCGPEDPDPVLVQLGAVRLDLTGDFDIRDRFEALVIPLDRHGARIPLSPLFTRLTGVTEARLAGEGQPLGAALAAIDHFAGGAPFWSWGKDELNAVAISCYVAGIAAPIPAPRFGNAPVLLQRAGVPVEEIHQMRSNTMAADFGLPDDDLQGHDAGDDAIAVARVLQHLLRTGRLSAQDFALPAP